MVSAIKMVTAEIVLSANHPDAPKWLSDVAIMSDKLAGFGGISGILAALSVRRNALVAAWDMPFISGHLLEAIARAGVEQGVDAVVPESDSPYGFEPFCAWYAASAQAPIERYLAEGGGSASDLVARLPRVHRMPRSVTERFGDPGVLFFSVNTPQDLARARAIADTAQ